MQSNEIIATLEQSLQQTRTQKQNLENRLQEIEMEASGLRQEIETLDKIALQSEEAIVSLLSASRSSRGSGSRQTSSGNEKSDVLSHRSALEDVRQPPNYQTAPPNYPNLSNRQNNDNYSQEIISNYPNRNYPNNSDLNYQTPNYPVNPMPNTSVPNYQGQNSPVYPNNSGSNFENPNYHRQNTNVVSMHQRNFRHHIPPINSEVHVQDNRFAYATITQACVVLLHEAGGESLHVNELYNRLLEGGFIFTGNNPTISIAVSLTRNRHFRKVAPGTFELNIKEISRHSA